MDLGLTLGYWNRAMPADLVDLFKAADQLGYDAVWSAESWGSDAFSPLVLAAAHTENIKLGTGVVQLSARTPSATAMHAVTLDHISNGRVILGLGVSVIVPMCFAIVGAMVSEQARTQAIARTAAFGYAGFFIGPPAMGFLSEWFGLSASFAFIGLSLLLVPILGLFLVRRMK